jgi:predicted metalloprotease with PDZ domain
MRALYNDFYKRGRGFSTQDMILVVNRLTGKDYHDFYKRYVFWTDVPDYDRIFGYAGYRIQRNDRQVAELGMFLRFRNGGLTVNGVEPESPASAAGVRQGDVITKINGQAVDDIDINSLAGKTVKMSVTRRSEELELPMTVGSRMVKNWQLVSAADLSPAQRRVRDAWLRR